MTTDADEKYFEHLNESLKHFAGKKKVRQFQNPKTDSKINIQFVEYLT